jgi:ribosomal protein S18 acetylase RimI-like enzyme
MIGNVEGEMERVVVSTLSVRKAHASDREFLFGLHVATMRDYVGQTWGWDDGEQRRMFDEHFNTTDVDVIECDGKAIGMQVVSTTQDSLELDNIEILPEHQGRGYGSALIGDILRRARATRRQVHLQVLKVNPARALYTRLGFELTGETQTHYLMAWRHRTSAEDATAP